MMNLNLAPINCTKKWLSFTFFLLSSSSLDSMCLHIENIKKKNNKMSSILPEYNCLLLSPANLWQQDFNKFQLDSNLINTVYNYQVWSTDFINYTSKEFYFSISNCNFVSCRISLKGKSVFPKCCSGYLCKMRASSGTRWGQNNGSYSSR